MVVDMVVDLILLLSVDARAWYRSLRFGCRVITICAFRNYSKCLFKCQSNLPFFAILFPYEVRKIKDRDVFKMEHRSWSFLSKNLIENVTVDMLFFFIFSFCPPTSLISPQTTDRLVENASGIYFFYSASILYFIWKSNK